MGGGSLFHAGKDPKLEAGTRGHLPRAYFPAAVCLRGPPGLVARLASRRLIAADRRVELRRIAAQESGPDAPANGVAAGRQAIRQIRAWRSGCSASSAFLRWPAWTPATAGRNSARAWIWPGIALELLGFVPIYQAIAENPFLERQVRVQTDLSHRVIATGPYRVVRHPMYSGLMLLLPGSALVLGSAWSLAPIAMLMATFVVRTLWKTAPCAANCRATRSTAPGHATGWFWACGKRDEVVYNAVGHVGRLLSTAGDSPY